MLSIKDFMETVDYKISEGSEYCWTNFGPNCRRLEYWDNNQDGVNISILYDTVDQTVYQMEAHDYANNRAYRWTGPAVAQGFFDECDRRKVSRTNAYDDVDYTDLETAEDMLEKARAIFLGEEYDTRIQIPLDLPDDVLFELMRQAHEKDQTLNQFLEDVLRTKLQEMKHTLDVEGEEEFNKKYQSILKKVKKKKKEK